MRFFEVQFTVLARETIVTGPRSEAPPFEPYTMVVTVPMGNGATPEDAVKELGRRLEAVCDDAPYNGD
jgi:hypothetical protein